MKIQTKLNTLFLVFILLMANPAMRVLAQQNPTDSIEVLLPHLRGAEKLEALTTLLALSEKEPAVMGRFTRMLLAEARTQKNAEKEALALVTMVEYYFNQFDTDSIFVAGEEAIRFMRQHNLPDNIVFVKHNMIVRHSFAGRRITALRMAEEFYQQAIDLQDNLLKARVLNLIAMLYWDMEQVEMALQNNIRSLELALNEREQDSWFFIEIYTNMTDRANQLGRHAEALQFNDSLKVEIERFLLNNPLTNMQFYLFAMEYHRVKAYVGLQQPEQALQAIRRIEAMFEPHWEGTFYEISLHEIYALYYHLTGNYAKALENLNSVIAFLESAGLENYLLNTQKLKAQILFDSGNFKAAAETALEVIERRQALNTQQVFAQINEFRSIFELDKAEFAIEQKRAANQRLQLMIASLTIFCIALILIVGLIAWSRRRIAEKNRGLYRQIKEKDRLAEELNRLMAEYNKMLQSSENPIVDTVGAYCIRPKINDLTKIKEGVCNLLAHTGSHLPDNPKHQELVSQLREHLLTNNNFANVETDINKLVSELGTNRTYLFDAVKSVTGNTLQEYINILRLEQAKKMLETTNQAIEIIAAQCGYNTYRTFFRQFREYYGITPSEYRKMMS